MTSLAINNSDFHTQVSLQDATGFTGIRQQGVNAEAIGAVRETIWGPGGTWSRPSVPQNIEIDDAAGGNVGNVVSAASTVTATRGVLNIQDSSATFVTDTVAIGDTFVNDTQGTYSYVGEIVSETELNLIYRPHKGNYNPGGYPSNIGDTYRILNTTSGAGVVHVQGLDANYDMTSDFVLMTGATPVVLPQTMAMVNRMDVIHASSNAGAAENVLATAATDAKVVAQINGAPVGVGYGGIRSNDSPFMIPADHWLIPKQISAGYVDSLTSGAVDVEFIVEDLNGLRKTEQWFRVTGGVQDSTSLWLPFSQMYPPRSIVLFEAIGTSGTTNDIWTSLDFLLVKMR
jgi:hypothetical protein